MITKARSHLVILGSALLVIGCVIAIFYSHQLDSTPPWRNHETTFPSESQAPLAGKQSPAAEIPFGFISYNVRNWLISSQSPEKSAESKAAMIQLLSEANPDVIGLCEIGSVDDVKEIQLMLAEAGTKLSYFHHTGGADTVRHLAILSRFPIIATAQPNLTIAGTKHHMRRGILDVTMDIHGHEVRFIGLHLKSKRSVPQLDQILIRLNEANHVRQHLNHILTENPAEKLIVYGDFNDTPRSLSTRAILGTYRSPEYITPVTVKDSRGETWTHYWDYQDLYSRIDYVATSKALSRNIDRKRSRIIDAPNWETASDHRPVMVWFK